MNATQNKTKAAKRTRIGGRKTAGRTPMFALRVDRGTLKRWKAAAKNRGETLSDFVRRAADERVVA